MIQQLLSRPSTPLLSCRLLQAAYLSHVSNSKQYMQVVPRISLDTVGVPDSKLRVPLQIRMLSPKTLNGHNDSCCGVGLALP